MGNPWEFLSKWTEDYTQPAAIFDPPDSLASSLAEQCLRAARSAGFTERAIIKAAGGDLQSFMQSEIESAANRELQRLTDKDRSG
ncbi:hypothetical protein ACJMQP_25845 [Rhodopseudomonas palustris]